MRARGHWWRRIARATLCGALWAAAAHVGAQATEDDDKSFEFSGENTTVVFAEGRERTVLSGDAQVISKSTMLFAESIAVFGEDFRFVECDGGVEVVDDTNNYRLKADTLFFDRELEILRGQGQAVLEDLNNEIVVKGEFLEFRNIEQRSEVQVGVRILGEDITARAEFVRYERETEVIEFTGLPFVLWKGDEYRASRIVVDMDDDMVELQGQVLGRIEIEDDEGEPVEGTEPTGDAVPEDAVPPDVRRAVPTDALPDSVAPSDEPPDAPTDALPDSVAPSGEPTDALPDEPTDEPTDAPTDAPTDEPTDARREVPRAVPIDALPDTIPDQQQAPAENTNNDGDNSDGEDR